MSIQNPFTAGTAGLSVLDVEDLVKSYRKTKALDGVGFSVPKGALTVILGPAGAGKTTTLRLVAGLEEPDSGRILLKGQDAAGTEPKDRDVAMIFDTLGLYPDKTGFENMASPLRIRRMKEEEIVSRVEAVAATLRVSHVLRREPRTMSGGERQRVALGRALVRDPDLFLLDEPLSSLDAMLRIELRAELRRLQRELGRTFLMTTPDFAEAMAIADMVVLLRKGRVVQIASPQVLYDLPADTEAARFVGAPEINLVPATAGANGEGKVEIAGVVLAAASVLAIGDRVAAGPFLAGIRPEHLRLGDPTGAPFKAELIDVEPLGLEATLTARVGAHDLRVVVAAGEARGLAVGGPVGLVPTGPFFLAFDAVSGRRLG